MPTYDHRCEGCGYEWEDFYSIHVDPPTICPKCGEAKARRLVRAPLNCKVKLEGAELKQHIKDERKKIKEQLKTDEKFKANIVGEEAYQNTEVNCKKIGEELKQII